jgi:hypothetical protein
MAKSLNKIFEARHLRFLVFSSFILVILFVGFLIFKPFYLDFAIVRYLVLIVISIFIALLFFILWPHDAILEKVPYMDIPLKVAGPIVLWVLVFLVTNKLLPDDINQTKMFIIKAAKESVRIPYDSDMKIVDKSNTYDLQFRLIEDLKLKTHLWGIVIDFPRGTSTLETEVLIEPYLPVTLKFDRTKSIIEFPPLILKPM